MTTKTETVKKNGKGSKADVKEVNATSNSNGNIIKADERRSKVNETLKDKPKADLPADNQEPVVDPKEETKPVIPVLTLEEKIAKVENLAVLIEKREKLQESRRKLNAFVIGSHQFSENIVLTDSEGNTFKTSNTEVFGSVVSTIRDTLDTKIREIEVQINF